MLAGGESGVQKLVFFFEDRRLTAALMLMGVTQWGGKTCDATKKGKGWQEGHLLVDRKGWHLHKWKVSL